LAVHVAGALAVWHTFMVVPAQVWDSLFGADKLDVALTDKADFALSAASRAAIWDDAGAITSISFETLLERLYEMVNNKMNVTDATGVVALRNIGNTGTIATGSVTDDLTTTVREELTWA